MSSSFIFRRSLCNAFGMLDGAGFGGRLAGGAPADGGVAGAELVITLRAALGGGAVSFFQKAWSQFMRTSVGCGEVTKLGREEKD
jgi:hypothetical protein